MDDPGCMDPGGGGGPQPPAPPQPPPAPPGPNPHMICEDSEISYVAGYLAGYNSPLAALAGQIVRDADAASVDDRFIVALAGAESRYGTTQRRVRWGKYNVFSNGQHCASLSNPRCKAVKPYMGYEEAVSDVLALLDGSTYQPYDSTRDIYAIYETGKLTTTSSSQALLDQIYGAQLSGNVSNVRIARCPD